jgi:hypothetical protein
VVNTPVSRRSSLPAIQLLTVPVLFVVMSHHRFDRCAALRLCVGNAMDDPLANNAMDSGLTCAL